MIGLLSFGPDMAPEVAPVTMRRLTIACAVPTRPRIDVTIAEYVLRHSAGSNNRKE
ncbi:hypothetical protein OCH239_01490 [Roseivivax halodurans JCM 10272]|uniref:Uncharacterized protein n=1 Tax=Roseivivax halodurans JCM 10272 TaxID=1449350 RepID=X7ELE5_9RHOB|nr:hypothetical protein OCH239_01490 [Roseivivax halodurans JCM 10272]